MKEIGIYIHIPFCKSKCFYCDFLSFENMQEKFEIYTNTLVLEIQNAKFLKDYKIKSIFIGGGTPTILSEYMLGDIIKELMKYNIDKNAEITIEANPGTLNKSMLETLKSFGVNRLSMGLQSCNNDMLKKLGRIHSYEVFFENYNEAIKCGFKNISIDLMFSLPQQTNEMWVDTLERITSLNPNHISAYSLIIEDKTVFSELYNKGKLLLPNEYVDRQMYEDLKKILKVNNYSQYEISNFSKPNYESIHNITYWERGNYIGFGLGSHSFFDGERFNNTTDFEKYIAESDKTENRISLSEEESIEEFIFLGLRMTKGISISKFQKEFQKNILDIYGNKIFSLKQNKFLDIKDDRIFLTDKGIDVSNMVFTDILV